MFMQQDWLMRQIEIMTMAIAQLLFGKDSKEHGLKEELKQEQSAELKQKLDALFKEGRLGAPTDRDQALYPNKHNEYSRQAHSSTFYI